MENQIIAFWSIGIGAIFTYTFYNIWLQEKSRKETDDSKIIGIKYFAYALLIWCINAIFASIYNFFFLPLEIAEYKFIYRIVRTCLSTANSAFLLLAIPSIEISKVSPLEVLKKEKKNVWSYSILVLLGTLAISFYIFKTELNFGFDTHLDSTKNGAIYFIGILDLIFAFFVIWELIIRMQTAFHERNMVFMTPISWLLMIFIGVSQILVIAPFFNFLYLGENLYLLLQPSTALIYKTLLITLFIVLIYSWEIKRNRGKIDKAKEQLKSEKLTNEKKVKKLEAMLALSEEAKSELYSNLEKSAKEIEKIKRVEKAMINKLTKRELEIIGLIDKTDLEIGKILHISKKGVISHRNNIANKLSLTGKEELLKYAQKNGLLKGD